MFLALYGSDFLGSDAGWSATTSVGRNEWNALALSPEFVNRINADGARTWTAHVPAGWEDASHGDLRRIAGGRLSDEPKDRSVWVRSEFSSIASDIREETESALGEEDETTMDASSATKTRGAKHHKKAKGVEGETKPSSEVSESRLGRVKAAETKPSERGGKSKSKSSPNASPKRTMPSLTGKGQKNSGKDSLLGGFIQDLLGPTADQGKAPVFDPSAYGLPESFDARTQWPKCRHLTGVARDQGNCGSCWAMAPAEVMSDRACIQSDGAVNSELSPFQLLACSAGSFGCEGGESADAYEFAKTNGVVTGGGFHDPHSCAPYPFSPCHHPCEVFPTPRCPTQCVDGETKVGFKVKAIVDCPSFDYGCVANEIYHNGPVSSYAGDIYEEFYAYKSGVFRESRGVSTRGANHGGHVVKVIGWGKADPDAGEGDGYYWIVVNSWLNWGDEGVGKIAVGEVGIGAGVESAVMDV